VADDDEPTTIPVSASGASYKNPKMHAPVAAPKALARACPRSNTLLLAPAPARVLFSFSLSFSFSFWF